VARFSIERILVGIANAFPLCKQPIVKIGMALLEFWLLTSCAPSPDQTHARLMDEIETNLSLPRGAGPLESYARYYARERDGLIIGAFTRRIEKRDAGVVCSQMTIEGDAKEIPCPALADAKVGERRWVGLNDFPAVADDNCGAIQIVYDPKLRRILNSECVPLPGY
jgi:hypothetical protein